MRQPRTLLISDTHLKHKNMKTYCQRPDNFTELIDKNMKELVYPEDTTIHLGDVAIGKYTDWKDIVPGWPGTKILIRGNHDHRSYDWWKANGFHFVCDAMIFRGCWLTHKPAESLPPGCQYNIHGHLHNIWDGFVNVGDCFKCGGKIHESNICNWGEDYNVTPTTLANPWQRLFAVEYTNYRPIEIGEFLAHPDKYQARGKVKHECNSDYSNPSIICCI